MLVPRMPIKIPCASPLRVPWACLRARGFSKTRGCYSGLLTFGGFESKLRVRVKHWGFKAQEVGFRFFSSRT